MSRALRVSIFRKVALSVWNGGGDPSVYSFVEVDLTDSCFTGSPLPYVVKALAETMAKNKELNSIIRWGQIYHHHHPSISVMVNIPDAEKDLSLVTLEKVNQMSVNDINQRIFHSAELVRQRKDPHLGRILKLIKYMPQFIIRFFLNLYSFLIHDLNTNLNISLLPKKPFGSVVVTNVGSLGIKKALVPLVPLTKANLIVSVGQVTDEAKVINGQIVPRKILHLGMTFDHRLFDGSHAAKMLRDFDQAFKDCSSN